MHHRFLTRREVERLVGVSRSTIYRTLSHGDFPNFVKVGGRSLWVESEIQEWIASKIAARRQPDPSINRPRAA